MTHFQDINAFLTDSAAQITGPIALILVEDEVEIDTTLRHHLRQGFKTVCALMPSGFALDAELAQQVIRIDYDCTAQGAVTQAVNTCIRALSGRWIYYGFNAEYLFYPFCETRSITEMLDFHTEERRRAMLTYAIDLYAGDLGQHPDAVSLSDAHLDGSGYYAQVRPDRSGHPKERQFDFFGGLRWRFEEHIPENRRKIDRIALFRARPGLTLRENHTFSREEYNTYSCPWHHNITAAICSFRTAKALKRNPGSAPQIETFKWHNSTPFEWHSRQLLDLGLIEPGQWF